MENDSTARGHMEMSQWVVYRHPRDYPAKYVARRWDVRSPGHGAQVIATDEVKLANTLDEIRRLIPPGLYCLNRFEDDDPCIVEVWI
jgi:hypothetical protein